MTTIDDASNSALLAVAEKLERQNEILSGSAVTIKGDSVHIRYSAYADGTDFTDTWNNGQNYMGVAMGQEAPINKSAYQWVLFNGKDYVLTDADKAEIVETVKTEVPLVKTAEQPTFVNGVAEMTDTSKVYVLPDGYMWAYMTGNATNKFSAEDFVVTQVESNGALLSGNARIATSELVLLADGTISIHCPSPYQYFIYYFTDNDVSSYIGKTSWKSGSIDDVLKDTIASGTLNGAKYCRISLRDSTNTAGSLTGRIDEFMENITILQTSGTKVSEWRNTGLAYNQPADYESRIVALENALGVIENGTY